MKPIKLKELIATAKDPATQQIAIAENYTLYVVPLFEGLVKDVDKALAALRQECPPKGSRRKITEIRHRLAAIPYPVTLELAIGSAHSAAASTLARCVATRKKYCSPTARQYALLVSTL